ncbi:MAG: 16S rRNA (guanine(527)-N(7))-methyltransferase RsmG, partial [Treponema sp.]|nr:16S rRNA (guanine(527)-N(7))-methyltransferase RsmG [Treponema sp.]
MIEKLEKGLATLGLDFDDAQKNKIEVYINEVLECNKTYNLMKADSEEELAVNHILDTLAAAPHLVKTIASIKEKNSRKRLEIGDIGSGGGCPGIPLAVAFPNEHFTLVERMEKRCVFLSSAIRRMGLENVEILCLQADKVP